MALNYAVHQDVKKPAEIRTEAWRMTDIILAFRGEQTFMSLDGSAPDLSSPIYQGPLELKGPATVRARAYRAGHTRSIAVHETFLIGD